MTEQTPSREDPGGTGGEPRSGDQPGRTDTPASPAGTQPGGDKTAASAVGTQPGGDKTAASAVGTQPGGSETAASAVGTQPGSGPENGYGAQPGHGTQPGYGAQPGNGAAPPPYGTPGYAQPGPDGSYPPPPPRNRLRMWFGIVGGIVVLALVIAGVSAYLLQKPKRWVVSAPQTVAGMHRDTSSLDQQGFGAAVSKFRSDVTSLPNYGNLSSTVSALYTDGSGRKVGFVGFNGTFKVQVVLKSANGLKVTSVPTGSHDGTAECGVSTAETICQWSTTSTVGIVVIIPSGSSAPEPASTAGKLMLQIRNQAEKPAHN